MTYRIGIGYDIHRLAKGRKLFLGGIEIPYTQGLLGHSDADVLLHALIDALLGAAGEKDIGQLFPDTDPQYQNISSLVLLERAYGRIHQKGYAVSNVDAVVIAQEPHLAAFKQQMQHKIAALLNLEEDAVGIKAKTQEGLGQLGKKKAIASYAVVLLTREGK